MDSQTWLVIFSTLLAISTFITAVLLQVRNVNYHQYENYCVSFFDKFKQRENERGKKKHEALTEVTRQHFRYLCTYKKNARIAQNAFWVACVSIVFLGIGWISTAICSIDFERECKCIFANYIMLILISVLLLVAAIIIAVWPHLKYIFKVMTPPEIEEAIKKFDKEEKDRKKDCAC